MSANVGAGTIAIRAAITDGYIRSAHVESTRPVAAAGLFVGRPADQAPVLAGRLFTLCGYSHRVASHLAVAAALGQPCRDDHATGLLAEKIGDSLRSLVIGWPDAGIGGLLSGPEVVLVRDALAACREMVAGQSADPRRVVQAVAALAGARLRERGLAALPRDQVFLASRPDSLTVDDDVAVVGMAAERGEDFAALPYLPGRSAETGAFARNYDLLPDMEYALAARMAARMGDLERSVADLEQGGGAGLWNSGQLGGGQGFGVVESPRGRLYHWVRLDGRGAVADYAIVAPTEWNFHPAGPFVSSLLGAKVGRGEQAQMLISWLAALFDPCVGFRVTVTEGHHA